MNTEHTMHKNHPAYHITDFIPLICMFLLVSILTSIHQWYHGFSVAGSMADFMGFFFVLFGSLKVININEFASMYATYDIVAKYFWWYGYLYPFIECTLGIIYLTHAYPSVYSPVLFLNAQLITIVLMAVSSIGVIQVLLTQQQITCACLGAIFKIPLTYVTLLEDVLMGIMAALMLWYR